MIENITSKLTLLRVAAMFLIWVLLFAIIYWVLGRIGEENYIKITNKENIINIFDAIYFSTVTATTLGYGDMAPHGGIAKLLTMIEVFGGIAFAGLAVNLLASLPSRTTRSAQRITGWWIERCKLSQSRAFFSFTHITRSGEEFEKNGINFDPDGSMDGTRYEGQMVINRFPLVYSFYRNDALSNDYTEGVLRLKFHSDESHLYSYYTGECVDQEHGKRDQIFGLKIKNKGVLKKLEVGRLSRKEMIDAIEELFPGEINI